MMNFGKLLSRGGVMLTHIRPEIFTGLGIAGMVSAGVLACRATMNLEPILDDAHARKDAAENNIAKIDRDTALAVAQLYAPSVAVGACSIGLIVGGHRILRKENAALGAAVTGLTEAFKKYRQRVVEDQGAEKDRVYRYGEPERVVEVSDEDGSTREKVIFNKEMKDTSPYFRWFDSFNPNWRDDPHGNLMFLKAQQNYANDVLHARGHLFLNEVYDMLGLTRTKTGQLVGWVDGQGDSFVDFGLAGFVDGRLERGKCDVVEWLDEIPLDFNVDGYVLDLFNMQSFQRRVAQ